MLLELYKPKTTIDRMFDDFFKGSSSLDSYYRTSFSPNLSVKETDDKVIINGELPGMKKDDVNVTYENGTLLISGEKKSEEIKDNERYHIEERSYGTFKRAIPLNQDLINTETINAEFKDGILNVEVQKVEKAQPKQIEVKVK